MKEENLKKFEEWWDKRRSKRKKTRGLKLSELTLKRYICILRKIPDIEINEKTNPDELTMFIRKWLNENIGKGKIFETNYPQIVFAIRTYLRMYENDVNPAIGRIAKTVRIAIEPEIYGSVKETDKIFREKFLTKEQIRKIILWIDKLPELPHKIPKEKAKLFFQLLYDTGCRIGELAKIRKKDINLETRKIEIWEGKGKKFRRVSFEESTLSLLQNQLSTLKDEDRIFGWNVVTMERYFKEIIKQINIEFKKEVWEGFDKISPHWFRHSRATHLAIVLKDMARIRDYMGWSDIKMADVYVSNIYLLPFSAQNYKETDLWKD